MANVLAHKTVSNTISVCTPAAQADVQASLTAIGLKQFIEQHQASLAYEQSMGWSGESLTKRIAWAQSVANFNNITMVEFQDLVACDIPSNVQYQYWLDSDSIQQSDPLRDAWNDIDKTGNISYDTAIAQTLTVNALLSHVRNIKSQLNNLNEIANSLKRPGVEIFPKQVKRINKDDIGNWINMPYHGGTNTDEDMHASSHLMKKMEC